MLTKTGQGEPGMSEKLLFSSTGLQSISFVAERTEFKYALTFHSRGYQRQSLKEFRSISNNFESVKMT